MNGNTIRVPQNQRTKVSRIFSRRRFIRNSSAWAGFAIWTGWAGRASGFESPNQRPRIGAVGTGSRWDQRATGIKGPHGSAKDFPKYGDIVAICDVDADRRGYRGPHLRQPRPTGRKTRRRTRLAAVAGWRGGKSLQESPAVLFSSTTAPPENAQSPRRLL